MHVLGIETSVARGTAALVSDGRCIHETVISEDLSPSANLTGRVEELFRKTQIELKNIDLIAVGLGPGSFTGIRVGVAFAKGLSAATGIPVVGFSGFDAVLSGLLRERREATSAYQKVAVLFDARRGEFYCRIYENGNHGYCPAGADGIAAPKELEKHAHGKTLFAGPGLPALLTRLEFKPAELKIDVVDRLPQAGEIALMASELTLKGRESHREVDPLYIRRTQAEEKLTT
jgi:tRNA threonylcarbamoyladenosine biosynthesis protein TsaB